jgi:diacylglycerol kinase family enzyme
MRFLFLLIFVMTLLSSKFANSKQITIITQDSISRNSVVFNINQPVGFINKVRIKVGYKSEKNSTYLLSLTNFNSGFDLLFTKRKYTGFQLCFEYQHAINKSKKVNYLFMVKQELGIITTKRNQV